MKTNMVTCTAFSLLLVALGLCLYKRDVTLHCLLLCTDICTNPQTPCLLQLCDGRFLAVLNLALYWRSPCCHVVGCMWVVT